MKTRLTIVILLIATMAHGAEAWLTPSTREYVWFRPARIILNGIPRYDPTDAQLTLAGIVYAECAGEPQNTVVEWDPPSIRPMTQQELSDRQDALDALLAAADSQDGLPEVFENGIAVLDADGHHMELVPTGDGLPAIGIQVSNSPITKEEKDALKSAGKAKWNAMKEKANGKGGKKLTKDEQLSLLMEAVFGVTE